MGNLFDALVLTGIALPLADPAGTLTTLIAHVLRIAAEHGPDRYGKRVRLTSPLLKFEKSDLSALHRKFRPQHTWSQGVHTTPNKVCFTYYQFSTSVNLLPPCDYILIMNGIAVLDDWNNMKQTTTIGEVLTDIHQPALSYTNTVFVVTRSNCKCSKYGL